MGTKTGRWGEGDRGAKKQFRERLIFRWKKQKAFIILESLMGNRFFEPIFCTDN